jgi:hypothetical protein
MVNQNYNHGKIYTIVNSENHDFFIGHTVVSLKTRLSHHRNLTKQGLYTKLFKHIQEVGVKNLRIELIEEYPCPSRAELVKRENYWINLLKPTLNMDPNELKHTAQNLKNFLRTKQERIVRFNIVQDTFVLS